MEAIREPEEPILVTIGIPTHNRAAGYLPETLQSARGQTYPAIEILVADNGSIDGTGDYVRGLSDKRIRYVRHSRPVTPNDNFNFCLAQARGEYFQLLHDDDLIDDDFVERCMAELERSRRKVGLIRTGAREIGADGLTMSEMKNTMAGLSVAELGLAWLDGKTRMFLCASLFNTKRLRDIGGFNSKHQLFQDVLAEFQISARFGRLDVPDVKASFRKHPEQNTHAARISEWCEDSMLLLDALCALAPEAADVIRRRGLRKFAIHNYNLARGIPNRIERYSRFFEIYRTFGYAYSPVRLAFGRSRNALRTRLKRRFRPAEQVQDERLRT